MEFHAPKGIYQVVIKSISWDIERVAFDFPLQKLMLLHDK
jgi:hypothetical protein